MSTNPSDIDREYEAQLDYRVDPSRDYFAEISAEVPPWNPGGYSVSDLKPGAALAEQQRGVGREVFDQRSRRTHVVPFNRYLRYLAPDGRIRPVTVSSARPTPESPNGDDGVGTDMRKHAEKLRSGWLLMEAEGTYGGRTGLDYLAWAFAVREHRIEEHNRREAAERADHESRQVAEMRRQTEAMERMAAGLVSNTAREVGKAVAEATARKKRDDAGA